MRVTLADNVIAHPVGFDDEWYQIPIAFSGGLEYLSINSVTNTLHFLASDGA